MNAAEHYAASLGQAGRIYQRLEANRLRACAREAPLYALPRGWTWRRVVAERVRWGIDERFVPLAVVPGAVAAWGLPTGDVNRALLEALGEAEQAITDCLEYRSHLRFDARDKARRILAEARSLVVGEDVEEPIEALIDAINDTICDCEGSVGENTLRAHLRKAGLRVVRS